MGSLTTQLRQVEKAWACSIFHGVTLMTLAVGIGGNTAIFSVLEGVLLKPLPYSHPEQLVAVWLTAPGDQPQGSESVALDLLHLSRAEPHFRRHRPYMGYSLNITGLGEPEHVPGLAVTDGLLPVLGYRRMLGRSFTRADDSPGSADTVMLTYGYWRRKFGGDRSVVGRTITVDGKLRQIIGVLPQEFHFPGQRELAMLMPLKLDRAKTFLGQYQLRGPSPGSSQESVWHRQTLTWRGCSPSSLRVFRLRPALASKCSRTRGSGPIFGR